ncbi:uncharacterized protein LOC133196170 [Saccostrea echinata]|uniref:uncharacterized protein LOC133196170 n=1 Tax=Saccostrea echinata TaxID=191078 RepID=UPI002A834A38|nr:uncharacterized protein LOC133196170 [Saccostrea echinata]
MNQKLSDSHDMVPQTTLLSGYWSGIGKLNVLTYIQKSVEAPCSTKTVMRWPLVPMICTQDVLLSTGGRSMTSCPLTFVDDYPYPSSLMPSVRLSGGSYIDIRLPRILSNSDYGFSAFVNPATHNHSCILHYKSDDGLFDMKFVSTSTETRATVSKVENLTVTHNTLQLGQWQKIGMGVDISQDKIQLAVDISVFDDDDASEKSTSVSATEDLSFHTPGTLRVGGSFDGETYSGLISCVSLIEEKKLDCSTGCYDDGTWSGVNNIRDKKHYGTFTPIISGKEPVQSPLFVTSAETLTPCALLCLKNYFDCASITYDVITKICSLFSGYFFIQMQNCSSSTTLYTLQAY